MINKGQTYQRKRSPNKPDKNDKQEKNGTIVLSKFLRLAYNDQVEIDQPFTQIVLPDDS